MLLPQFPPPSYVEAPGYILPHTQLHMVDYRRMMTPHTAPTMAYQARRFRYQQTMPAGRVMVSSEVQTELVGAGSQNDTSESGRSSGSGSAFSSPKPDGNNLPACPTEDAVIPVPKKPASTSPAGILFQAEEVRIECSGSQSAEDVVMRCFQSVQFGENDPKKGLEDVLEEPYLPPCSDLLLMRSGPADSMSMEGSEVMPAEPTSSTMLGHGDLDLVKGADDDDCNNPKNVHFKILRLPLELPCLDELHQMEASVWSVESLMPYIPSNEWLIQNGLLTPQKQSLETVMEVEAEVLPRSVIVTYVYIYIDLSRSTNI